MDYEDYLRVHRLPLWDKESREARYVRRLGRRGDESYGLYRDFCETRPAGIVANIAICLICQATCLLDRQVQRLERDFVKYGGIRERMTKARLRERGRQ